MNTPDPSRSRPLRAVVTAVLALFVTACGDAPTQNADTPREADEEAATPQARDDAPRPTWRHPLGVAFDLPHGWRVAESPGALELVPPDRATGPQGPTEYHVVAMLGADPAIRSLDEPRAATQLDLLVRSRLPGLARSGGATPVTERADRADDVRRFTYRGRSPFGTGVECRVVGLLRDGWFLAVTSVGDPAVLRRREPALVGVDRTLTRLAPQADRELASTWFSQASNSAGSVGDRIHVSTTTGTTLHPDGSISSRGQGMVVGATGGGRRPGSSVTGLTDLAGADGLWARAPGGDLYVLWRDGSSMRYRVHVQGGRGRREMLLTPPQAPRLKLLWTEYRP